MSDYYQVNGQKQDNIFSNPGFHYGLIGGLILVVFRLLLMFLFRSPTGGDLLAIFLAWFVYYFIGRQAAQKQFEKQQDELEPTRGVRAAGTGAALVTSILVWIFIVIRGIFRDALGIFVIVSPVGLFCAVVADVLVALGIGSWAGKRVARRYQIRVDY